MKSTQYIINENFNNSHNFHFKSERKEKQELSIITRIRKKITI